MKIEPPSLNSGNAFCTVNNVPRAFSPKVASKCCSVISPSLRSSPIPALAHNTSTAPFSLRTASNNWSSSPRVGRICLHASNVPADQLHSVIQSFLPPTRDEDVSSLFNEHLGTG